MKFAELGLGLELGGICYLGELHQRSPLELIF